MGKSSIFSVKLTINFVRFRLLFQLSNFSFNAVHYGEIFETDNAEIAGSSEKETGCEKERE
jgi:hypothetical protein